ncbi:ribonuclease J1 [Pediococcus cellicola]|uniref:Ribonuclease J n=1 Tax=Pediococcus cellicola TaxID=319652 RepID=A0A0R2IZ46_9LACO|nr:ribonuclease J [Pediococcus cellicola]KRN67628.1 beta-lactamase domain-containing protein [Pediococcus cellicola]GEL14382.1 ribonuclease J [Pediococcus cellicola]
MRKLKVKNNEVAVYAVGGLGEIGKNMYCVQYQDEIVIIDCGIKFPEDELLGVDYIIPDYQFLIENQKKIKALVITHGHEDHIGGIPFFLQKLNVPIWAGPFASELIKGKLKEHNLLRTTELHELQEDTVLKFRKLSVSFFRTTHSIPDTLGIAVHTPQGTVVQTGDFKFDLTPVGGLPSPDFQKMAAIGGKDSLLLMSDSTNAERPTFTKSERFVEQSIKRIFTEIQGRIIFATFASNVYRVREACEAALAQGRKIAIFGRSMENAIEAGQKLGYLNIPEESLVDAQELKNLPANKLMILCTGSQGEPMAALSRIANGTHRQISLQPDDTVVFSSNPIPGNTVSVNHLINKLDEAGVTVIHGKVNNIHTSGHGGQEDQKLMLRLIKPKFFMPCHGEYRMQMIHKKLAQQTGVPEENCFIMKNGDVLALTRDSARIADHFSAGDVYLNDADINDNVSSQILSDRTILASEGVVTAVATINIKKHRITAGPDTISRGFIYMRESNELIHDTNKAAFHSLLNTMKEKAHPTEKDFNTNIIDDLQEFLYQKTERSPMIVPMLIFE